MSMSKIYTKSTLEKKVKNRIYLEFTFQFNSFLIDNALKNVDQLRILIVSDRTLSPVLLENFIHENLEKDKNLRSEDGLQHHLTQVNLEDVINDKHDDMIYAYNINSMRSKGLFDKAFKDLNEQIINIYDYYPTAYLFEVDLSDLDFKNTKDKESQEEYSTLELDERFKEQNDNDLTLDEFEEKE